MRIKKNAKKMADASANSPQDEKTVAQAGTHEALLSLDTPKRACFIVIHGPNLGKKFTLHPGEMVIGRVEDADIRINEENVSRKHAKVRLSETNTVSIEDLKSTNGIFVNTKRVSSEVLKDGDLILVGNTILKFISSTNIENDYHEEIYKLATLDGLTQAYNKKYLIERLSLEFSRSTRYSRDLSFILFDFDNFKKINDIYGHLAGDFVLKKSTSVVVRNLRKEDVLGRYGGEEFGVILPETNISKAIQLAEKIRAIVEGVQYTVNHQEIPVTISVGVSSYLENTAIRTYNDLIAIADASLYEAKNGGKNRVVANRQQVAPFK